MKRARRSSRAPWVAALALAGVWAGGGCQSIAGVDEVEYLGTDENPSGCAEYCDLVLEACRGDKSVYEDRDTCLATCAAFDSKNPASSEADTFACRLEQARHAASIDEGDKLPHCLAAGPGGGAICASDQDIADCEGYCSLFTQACPSISMDWGFKNAADCVPKCALLRSAGNYSVATAPDSGDSLECRLFYTSRALVDPSEFNCKSASLYPNADFGCEPIGEPDCNFYCDLVQATCTGAFQVYESVAQCRQVCRNIDPGRVSDAGGQDTLGCRIYHAYNAMVLAALPHCSHSGPAGNGVCSVTDDTTDANCIPYCRLARAGCEELFDEKYDNENDCLQDCSTFEGAKPLPGINGYNVRDAQQGNTLQCRVLHAARALEKPDDRADFCPAVFGGAPCDED